MSGTEAEFKYCSRDFLFTCVGLLLFLLDIGLDMLAAVSLYHEKAYVYFSLLLLFLFGSSVLVQVYSWLWYSYDEFKMKTKIEKVPSMSQLKVLHVFQLGIFLRYAGVMEKSVQSLYKKRADAEGVAKFLRQDLRILRFVETFSESAPQLALMLTIILREGRLDPVTVLKAVGSTLAIASFLTTYHHSVRSFLCEKEKHHIISLVLYFSWNLLLISSRLAALALFASVLPCFIFTHFICSWLVLFFFAWRSKTDFMDGPGGEWLYRATVGLIWYFDWFNVTEGNTRNRTVLYHGFMLADISVLCGVWCWRMSTDPPEFVVQPLHALITAVCVAGVYVLGLLLKVIYYKCFHPNLDGDQLKGASTEQQPEYELTGQNKEEHPEDGVGVHRSVTPPAHCHKRMRKLALNFYS
ncbi:XK-related protein 8-like [Archocentrus centrarchus]|uniref:XK-related protein 8-like n=1 Tax=Archocentrus centrarchus TaxID=63155 RepID=UPI0011E9C114|nr:XK-related protein 8-like [Archocentrus centrarchus]